MKRWRDGDLRQFFRGEAASARPELYGYVEVEDYMIFQMAEVAIPRKRFAAILERIQRLAGNVIHHKAEAARHAPAVIHPDDVGMLELAQDLHLALEAGLSGSAAWVVEPDRGLFGSGRCPYDPLEVESP